MNPTAKHPGVQEWYRRHRFAERLAPLADGTVDPWLKDLRPPLTDAQVDGAVAAAEHLLSHGLPPLFEADVLRAMWQHGHRQLACDLWAIYHGDREAA